MPSAIAEPEEIHIGLDVPKATARQIYLWARRQDWPEDTQLEPPGEYHVTLLFSTAGREHKDEWWLEHMDTAEVSTVGVRAFPSGEKGGFAYVLLLEAPEVLEKATEMQERGKAFGMPIRDFDGGYKPHITVAYGPAPRLNIKPPNFTFDVGPSSVSPMRPKESKIAMPADPDWWNTQPTDLWHGTSLQHLPSIMEHGLVPWDDPRNTEGSLYDNVEEVPRPNHVYLAYEPHEALNLRGSSSYDTPLLLRVNRSALHPDSVNPDEDSGGIRDKWLADELYKYETPPDDWQPATKGEYAHQIGWGNNPHDTQRGIADTRTLAHQGPIPPHALTPYIQDRNMQWTPMNRSDWGASSLEDLEHIYSSAPPEPPNYRKQDKPSEHCGNCKMQFEGRCWGFANKEVQPDAVCNEWAPEEKRSAYNPNEVKILDHLSLTNVAANLHYKFQEGGLDDGGANEYAKKMLQLIGYPPDDITVRAALDAWQKLYPADKLLNPAPPTVPTESWGYGTTSRVSEKFSPTRRDLSYSFSKRADLHDEVLPSWENKGFTVLHEETPEQVHLHTVELPPDTRGQGYGHRFMDNIKHYVDQNGKPLVVDPVFNPQFFDKFDWLNPTGERRYEYQPQRIEAKKGSAPDLRYLHASDNEYEPGTQLLPPAQTGHSSDFTNTPWYDPNYVYLRDHRADPVAFENYGANIYLVEPEGKVEQDPEHDPKRYEYPEDDPAYYSWRAPSARIVRKLTDQDLDDFYSGRGLWKHGGDITHCLNCGHPLEDSLDTCPECSSTVPSQVNNPEDHIPEFGQRPPDQKRDIQFSNDWNYR